MGQNKRRSKKSTSQRTKPIQGKRATSASERKARAKTSSPKESPANKAPLAAHLETFAKAVADDHSHVEAAILAGRARGSASFLYRQPGVKNRIAELLAIKKKASEEAVAKSAMRPRRADDMDDGEIRNILADIGRSKTEQSRDRIRALTALPKIRKNKRPEDLKAHGYSDSEIEELFATGAFPTRLLLRAGNAEAAWIAHATSDAFTWMTEHTKTRNEHWKEEGRTGPYEHLPRCPLDQQPADRLDFANGSYILGIPGGANQIRSYHPWGYLNDESSFQADAGECYNEALAAVKGKIVFNSSAGTGWYANARKDITTN